MIKSALGVACLTATLCAQTNPAPSNGRMFGVFGNDRTVLENRTNIGVLTAGEKWKFATGQTFEPISFVYAAVSAGVGQAENQFPAWKQGGEGFAKRYGAAFADRAVDDYLTGAIFPILMHEDPRYYRRGSGGFFHRVGYAISRTAVARTDAGANRLSYSEFLGTAVAAGISNAYYPVEQRTAAYTAQHFGVQIASDALFNVLKEFWPDVTHKLRKSSPSSAPGASLR